MTKLNTSALRDLIGQHGASKPETWSEIPMIEEGDQRAEFLKAMGTEPLPTYHERMMYGSVGKHHCALDFSVRFEAPQFFLMTRDDGQAFLINTEGYNYAREAIRVL